MDIAETRVDREVQRLFKEKPPVYGKLCRNPITDALYVGGLDPTSVQKDQARRALLARERFVSSAPPDAPPFPVSYWEREELKRTGGVLPRIVAWYARSLEAQDYDVHKHPSFADYAAGVLWEVELPVGRRINNLPDCYYGSAELEELKRRYPPRMLKGMSSGLYWYPPKRHAEAMENLRRWSKDPSIYFNRE